MELTRETPFGTVTINATDANAYTISGDLTVNRIEYHVTYWSELTSYGNTKTNLYTRRLDGSFTEPTQNATSKLYTYFRDLVKELSADSTIQDQAHADARRREADRLETKAAELEAEARKMRAEAAAIRDALAKGETASTIKAECDAEYQRSYDAATKHAAELDDNALWDMMRNCERRHYNNQTDKHKHATDKSSNEGSLRGYEAEYTRRAETRVTA